MIDKDGDLVGGNIIQGDKVGGDSFVGNKYVFGDAELIEKRKKAEHAYGFAKAIRDAINEYNSTIPAFKMGKIIREVGSTMFLDDDINDFCFFQDGLEGK